MFGTSLIHGTARRRRGKRHDCGKSGRLTVQQIADAVGITEESVRSRIKAGYTGEALLIGKREGLRMTRTHNTNHPSSLMALKIARRFPDRVPSLAEIQKLRPMSKTSANRWRQMWKTVLEDAA
jgi:predicted transcriptional regulator